MLDQAKTYIDRYRENGYVSGLPVFSGAEVARIRGEIESLEADKSAGAGGYDLGQFFRVNGHVVIPLLADLARTPLGFFAGRNPPVAGNLRKGRHGTAVPRVLAPGRSSVGSVGERTRSTR